jgi:putative peptidoglycan lipid II flippase
MDSPASLFRSFRHFFAGTMLSRIMGMVRDVTMAFCFGGAPEVAAFMVAYRLANLFRRLLGESNLQAGFVPEFERLRLESEEKANTLYRDLFVAILVVLAFLIAISGVVCCFLQRVLESDIPMMTFCMLPGVLFLCLYALNSAILQCQKRYFLPAVAPVLFNAVWIVSALLLYGKAPREAMFTLSLAVCVAFLLQWLMTHGCMKVHWKDWLSARPFSKEVRSLLKPLAYGIVGIGAVQINSALDAIFARLADPSGPLYLWYAIRIQQLPLSLLGIALANAMLPPLSRAHQSGERGRYRELLKKSLKQGVLTMGLASLGMMVFAHLGVSILYGHGNFLSGDVRETVLCLRGYAVGLVPMVLVLLFSNGFYAQKEYKWPMRCSMIAVACNVFLNSLFVFFFHWGSVSIALATSASAFVNCGLLAYGLRVSLYERETHKQEAR